MGCSPDGRWARAGGWGPQLGDEGSGYALGLAALHAITQAADGRGPLTRLTAQVLETWGLPDAASLVGYVYQQGESHTRIAGLAPLVRRAAAMGDRIALEIEAQAAVDLAKMAVSVARQLGFTETAPYSVPCALGGGVMIHNESVVRGLVEAARQDGVNLEPVEKVSEPAKGAVRLALKVAQP